MKQVAFAAIVLMSLLMAGCTSGINIKGVDKDPAFSISKYKTFGFHETEVGGKGLAENFGPNLELLKNAITSQMELKGVTRTQSNPDLIVNIGVMVDVKDQTRETNLANPGDRHMTYMGGRNYGWQTQEIVVGQYREGSVTVDLVDKNTFKLVWTGTAEAILPDNANKVPETIKMGMKELFAQL